MRIAQCQRHVGAPEGRSAERPGPVHRPTDGIVWKLHAKYYRVEQRAAVGGFVVEINVVAARLKTETQVNAWRGRVAVRIENEILAGAKLRCSQREAELERHPRVVGQTQSRQLNGSHTVVVEFDQVGGNAGVGEGGRVHREELVDTDARLGRRDIAWVHCPGARSRD